MPLSTVEGNVMKGSVVEHIAAFRIVNSGKEDLIMAARRQLRELISDTQTGALGEIDDMEILSVLIEEFAQFAVFVGEEIQRENAKDTRAYGQTAQA